MSCIVHALQIIPNIEVEDCWIHLGIQSATADLRVVFEAEGPVLSTVRTVENALEVSAPEKKLVRHISLD